MPRYSGLTGLLAGPPVIGTQVVPYLVREWLTDYDRVTPHNEIVEKTTSGFSYLFDIMGGRLLSAWGISQGRNGGIRDKPRMAGHPLSAGTLYHRGHAIPHTLGGSTDINLVPQLGSINVGPFRALENRAVATPGALYFTYWHYANPINQTPIGVDQGLIIPGQTPDIRRHGN